jgi:hypothetical protein
LAEGKREWEEMVSGGWKLEERKNFYMMGAAAWCERE